MESVDSEIGFRSCMYVLHKNKCHLWRLRLTLRMYLAKIYWNVFSWKINIARPYLSFQLNLDCQFAQKKKQSWVEQDDVNCKPLRIPGKKIIFVQTNFLQGNYCSSLCPQVSTMATQKC